MFGNNVNGNVNNNIVRSNGIGGSDFGVNGF